MLSAALAASITCRVVVRWWGDCATVVGCCGILLNVRCATHHMHASWHSVWFCCFVAFGQGEPRKSSLLQPMYGLHRPTSSKQALNACDVCVCWVQAVCLVESQQQARACVQTNGLMPMALHTTCQRMAFCVLFALFVMPCVPAACRLCFGEVRPCLCAGLETGHTT